MLKKTIQFEDLDGNQVSEDFYFHLNKADVIHWELSELGGYSAHLERALALSKKGDSRLIGELLKQLVERSIGERSADNRSFERHNGAVARRFMETDAYSVLFMELGTDATAAADFMEALVPKSMQAEVAAEIAKQKQELVNLPDGVISVPSPEAESMAAEASTVTTTEIPAWIAQDRDPTTAEMRTMTPEQMQQAFAAKEARLNRDKTPGSTLEGTAAQ